MEKKLPKLVIAIFVFTTSALQGQWVATYNGVEQTNNLVAITGSETVLDYYAYSTTNFSFTRFTLDEFSINTFIYQQTGGPQSFVTVYGPHTILSSSRAEWPLVTSSGEIQGIDIADALYSVTDDADPDVDPDTYELSGTSTAVSFSTEHVWDKLRTDGFAISDVDGFTKLIQSVNTDERFINTTWNLYSGNGEKHTFDFVSANAQLILTPVPEPTTIGLLALVGLPLALIIRRRIVRK